MHILHLIKTSEGAGWSLHLMQEIKKRDPNISFSVAIQPGGKHAHAYHVLCRNVYEFDYQLNVSIFQRGKILREIVSKDNPDIIHSWFTQTTLYASRIHYQSILLGKILYAFYKMFPLRQITNLFGDMYYDDSLNDIIPLTKIKFPSLTKY